MRQLSTPCPIRLPALRYVLYVDPSKPETLRLVERPATSERAVSIRTAGETDGALLEMELGGRRPRPSLSP